jgi:hypothetical protein
MKFTHRKLGLWLLTQLEDSTPITAIAKAAYQIYSNHELEKDENVNEVLYDLMLMDAGEEFERPRQDLETLGLSLINQQ